MLQLATQVHSGLKHKEELMVATLVEIKPDYIVEVLDCIAEVLDKFQDVMPVELPKVLPLKRNIDRKIELEPEARPPVHVPYRMTPSKLTKLRKQLNELLEVGFIQPSKAPYGASMLFQ